MDEEKYVIRGPKLFKPLPKESVGKQLYDNLLHNVHLPTAAFIDAVTSAAISWTALLENSCRLAESLQKCGFGKGDVIAVCSENGLKFFVPVLASLYLGITVTTLNPYYTPEEILHCADISKPVAIFCSKYTTDSILKAKEKMGYVRKIIVMNNSERSNYYETIEDFISNNLNPHFNIKHFTEVTVNTTEEVALILYSSGTTGLPKGVMLTHNNVNGVIWTKKDPRYNFPQKSESETVLGLMPFYHAYGLFVGLINIVIGRQTVVLKQFNPDVFLKAIQDYKISALYIAPPLANFLAKSPLINKYNLSHVKLIACGAAPLSEVIQKKINRRFKPKMFQQAYGMTETTLGVLGFQFGDQKSGSCGKVLPGILAKVVDQNSRKALGPRQAGEFRFKGHLIMKGYAGNDEATKEMIDEDGWLASGDVGYYDEEGYFYVTGRLKELIKYKGFQVPPAELEAILLTHPKIADAGVIGLPDDVAGELPLAFIVKEPNHELTDKEVIDFIATKVSAQKRLRGGVRFVSGIPKNPSGKILRRELRTLLQTPKAKL